MSPLENEISFAAIIIPPLGRAAKQAKAWSGKNLDQARQREKQSHQFSSCMLDKIKKE